MQGVSRTVGHSPKGGGVYEKTLHKIIISYDNVSHNLYYKSKIAVPSPKDTAI